MNHITIDSEVFKGIDKDIWNPGRQFSSEAV